MNDQQDPYSTYQPQNTQTPVFHMNTESDARLQRYQQKAESGATVASSSGITLFLGAGLLLFGILFSAEYSGNAGGVIASIGTILCILSLPIYLVSAAVRDSNRYAVKKALAIQNDPTAKPARPPLTLVRVLGNIAGFFLFVIIVGAGICFGCIALGGF